MTGDCPRQRRRTSVGSYPRGRGFKSRPRYQGQRVVLEQRTALLLVVCARFGAQRHPAPLRAIACYLSIEETILSFMENNPSWLLPLLPSRATGALLALLYLHPDRDYTLTEAGRLISASPKVMHT